jgi:hypothetical protein
MEAMLAPEVVETEVGALTIKGIFRTLKDEIIAGGEVTSGKVMPGLLARVKRDKEVIAEVEVTKVQRQQQEAKEVFEGEMCGISLKIHKRFSSKKATSWSSLHVNSLSVLLSKKPHCKKAIICDYGCFFCVYMLLYFYNATKIIVSRKN